MIATEALSKDDINIIEGEIVIKSLVEEMSKQKTSLAVDFHQILIGKLIARRNSLVTSLILYLMNSDTLSKNGIESYPLKLENKKSVQQLGTKMLKRLYEEAVVGSSEDETVPEDEETLGFQEILKKNIEKQLGIANCPGNKANELNTISKDFKFYDLHKKKSPQLENLFLALCSIQPTSVQSERNFSLASCFVTKIRSLLSHQHIDMLCFLKSKFMTEKKMV